MRGPKVKWGIGSDIDRAPDVTGHHGQERVDTRRDRNTQSASARLRDLRLEDGRSCQVDYPSITGADRFLTTWLLAVRWRRLRAFEKLGRMLTRHLEGIVHYCQEKVPFGTVEAINGNIRAMLRRGQGYRDDEYLLPKVHKATAPRRLHRTA